MYKHKKLGKKINKKNKNLPLTSQPKLLRSIQMRNLGFQFKTMNIKNISKKDRLSMTQKELEKYIKDFGPAYCNEVMGVDCDDGGNGPGPEGEFSDFSPFNKWKTSGGECPEDYMVENSVCASGCGDSNDLCFSSRV